MMSKLRAAGRQLAALYMHFIAKLIKTIHYSLFTINYKKLIKTINYSLFTINYKKLIITINYSLFTINCVLLLSCSSDSAEDAAGLEAQQPQEPQQHVMGFTADLAENGKVAGARGTRTVEVGDGELTTELLQETGFGVYCWYTGSTNFDPNFTAPYTHIKDYTTTILMLNQWVTYDESATKWDYTPSKYWPLNASEKLTFRAYAPFVSYGLQLNAHGMPMLPVVVKADDYQNGTQHDPLWGTGRLVNPETNEYYDEPAPSDPDQSKSKRYGQPYNNYTYEMSGDLLAKDSHDGIINWYFHHGMAKLIFTCKVIANPGCDKVIIKGIEVTPLYNQGLLDLSSSAKTDTYPDKPTWAQTAGNMKVEIGAEHLKENPLEINTKLEPPAETDPYTILEKGLLIIPRTFSGEGDMMDVTITYSIDNDPTELLAYGHIKNTAFYGNTIYTLDLKLTPSTQGLEITMVQSAFTKWKDGGTGPHAVYNW